MFGHCNANYSLSHSFSETNFLRMKQQLRILNSVFPSDAVNSKGAISTTYGSKREVLYFMHKKYTPQPQPLTV